MATIFYLCDLPVRWMIVVLLAAGTVSCTHAPQRELPAGKVIAECSMWDISKLPEEINTDGDELAPVPINDSMLLFTRGHHATSQCASEDIFLAVRTQGVWKARNVRRPVNDCHENSVTSYDPTTNTVVVYSQYYASRSAYNRGAAKTASAPNDVATRSVVPFIWDPDADHWNPLMGPPPMVPQYWFASPSDYENMSRARRTSEATDFDGDLYTYAFRDGEFHGFPIRLEGAISSEAWESDGVWSPDRSLLVFTSDRDNSVHSFDAKKPYVDGTRRNPWGNTALYAQRRADSGTTTFSLLSPWLDSPLAERTPSFSRTGDTLYFSSNGFDGFGGMDVFYAVRTDIGDSIAWTRPRNLGSALNTRSDELWLTPWTSDRFVFAGRTEGDLNIYEARRRDVGRMVFIESTCPSDSMVDVTFYDAALDIISSLRTPPNTAVAVPRFADHIGLRSPTSELERVLCRCRSTDSSIIVTTDHLHLRPCTQQSGESIRTTFVATIHPNETQRSIEATLAALIAPAAVAGSGARLHAIDVAVTELHRPLIEDFCRRMAASDASTVITIHTTRDASSTISVQIESGK
jgi:hypothetical protein